VNKPTFAVGCDIIFLITNFTMFMNLSTLVTIRSGNTFKNGIQPSSHRTHSVIQLRDVDKSDDFFPINWDDLCWTELSPRFGEETLMHGDVIIVAKGQVKKAFCLEHVPFPAVVNQHFFVLKVKDTNVLQPEFLAHYLNSRTAQDWMNINSKGAYQSTVSKKVLSDLPIAIVTVQQQKAILEKINIVKADIFKYRQSILEGEKQLESLFEQIPST
jgi:hypothetical protein